MRFCPHVNVTFSPSGGGAPPCSEVTVAVKVTDWPYVDGFNEDEIVVMVLISPAFRIWARKAHVPPTDKTIRIVTTIFTSGPPWQCKVGRRLWGETRYEGYHTRSDACQRANRRSSERIWAVKSSRPKPGGWFREPFLKAYAGDLGRFSRSLPPAKAVILQHSNPAAMPAWEAGCLPLACRRGARGPSF